MKPRIIPVNDDAHWHELRNKCVGSSEIAALFDASPYLTRFELWHRKKGTISDVIEDNERMYWGRQLEGRIAAGIAGLRGWNLLESAGTYYPHAKLAGMGCTPDFLIHDPARDPDLTANHGIMEVKNVDYLSFRQRWNDGEPPLHYILQLQHQLACTGLQWGCIAALIGGNTPEVFMYDRHPQAIERIEKAVCDFWQSIEQGKEPPAVCEDYDVIRKIMGKVDEEIDLTHDNELPDLCARAKAAAKRKTEAEKEEKFAKATIIQKMNGYARARCAGFNLKATTVNKQAYTVAAQSYKQLNIREDL